MGTPNSSSPLTEVPFSLGLADSCGRMVVFIDRNSKIPIEISNTWFAYGRCEKLRIYEGERLFARDNKELGSITLSELPYAHGDEAEFEVTFTVNNDCTLRVTAERKAMRRKTRKKNTRHFDYYKWQHQVPSKQVIEDRVAGVLRFQADDQREIDRLVARDQLDQYCSNMERSFMASVADERRGQYKNLVLEKRYQALFWLLENQMASKEEFERRLEDLKAFREQIL